MIGRYLNGCRVTLRVVSSIALMGGLAGAQAPADSAPPTVAAMAARLRTGDAAGAVRIGTLLTTREPANAAAWRLLGTAAARTGDYAGALAAFRHDLALEPTSPVAMYDVGAMLARMGAADSAFTWLGRARATRRLDMTQVAVDSDLVSLRHDARFARLLPTRADFDHPFVEPVTIIHEWDGEGANDQFGWIARDAGDVDGDGVHDVVTSAPTRDIGGANAGRVYVYSGRSGRLLWSADGKPGDFLGMGVESAGDVNHDGIPDVIASAQGSAVTYVYSGRDGRLLRTLHAEGAHDRFGAHVAGVGDVDGDGYDDVMVGAPRNGAGGDGAGRAYLFSGRTGALLLTLTGEQAGDAFGSTVGGVARGGHTLLIVGAPGAGPRHTGRVYVYDGRSPVPHFVIDSDSTGVALGAMFVSAIGDVDGDGVADVYATDFPNAARGASTGRAYVHSGADGRRLLTLTGERAGDGFGIGRATVGDVDGDGRADLVIGAWQYGATAVSAGRVYLFSGRDGHVLQTYTSRIPGETLGFDAVGIGDVNGDGVIDLLVTSAWSGIHGLHTGRVYVISSHLGSSVSVRR